MYISCLKDQSGHPLDIKSDYISVTPLLIDYIQADMDSELRSTLAVLDPSYTCRYKARYHPKSEETMAAARDYFAQHWPWPSEKIKQSYIRAKLEEATCISFPTTIDDRIETVVLALGYVFFLDDILENLEEDKAAYLADRLANIIIENTKPDPKDQLGWMAADIFPRLLSDDSGDGQKYGMDALAEGAKWIHDVANVKERLRSMENLDSYMKWRETDIALWFTVRVFLWGCGIYMPQHMAEDLDIIQALRLAGHHMTLANDLFSHRVEALKSIQKSSGAYFVYNAVSVISGKKEVDIQTAMNEVKQRLSEMEDEFELLIEKLQEKYVDEEGILLTRMVQACKDLMAGNCEWSGFCYRYNEALGLAVIPTL